MYRPRQLAFAALTLAALMIGWAARGDAQIIYPYPYPPYYGYGYHYGEPLASVRLDVTPKEAEVYVDGYYAGIVDDFDGIFQRLHATPGAHTLTLYYDGYRTVHQQLYLPPDDTFKVKYKMERLAPGENAEARPLPPPPPPEAQAPVNVPPPGPGRRRPFPPFGPRPNGPPPPDQPPAPNGPPSPEAPPPPPQNGPQGSGVQPGGMGTISLRVQPADADVLIDGQPWKVPNGQDRLMLDASVGPHSIQVRKDGYVGYLTQIIVRGNQTTTLDVNLRRQQ